MVDKLTNYIYEKYGSKPNHPWKKYPEYATFKAKDTDKWFVLIMHLEGKTIGLMDVSDIWVMNVKASPDFVMMTGGIDGIMPAYHMNKEHWITVLLDGTVAFEQVAGLVDVSYELITDSPTKRIYEAVARIPRGKVATYGRVAEMAGNAKMSRAVGNALHKNPDPDRIPCYRVVNSKGELAEAFAFGGINIQEQLLMADGIEVVNGKVDLKKYGI